MTKYNVSDIVVTVVLVVFFSRIIAINIGINFKYVFTKVNWQGAVNLIL